MFSEFPDRSPDFRGDRRKCGVRNDVWVMHKAGLVRTAPPGAATVFAALYQRTLSEVYSYLFSRVRDRATAEDLTQEVYLAGAHRAAAGEAVDLPWLIAVARHKLVDHWRAQHREDARRVLADARQHEEAADPAPIDPGRAGEVLASLNPTYRLALVLRHVDGLAVTEVAANLGRSVEATEQVLTRARAAFRHTYQGTADD
jgi:RNA polymerase sigma-70 factor, ECF subfamily